MTPPEVGLSEMAKSTPLPLSGTVTDAAELPETRMEPGRAPSATFREVRLPPLGPGSAGWVAEVTWPSGVTVRFGAGAEAAWIGAVLDVVRQAC